MGKPAVVMFVGVGSLSDEDELRLPDDVAKLYREGFYDDLTPDDGERIPLEFPIEGVTLECIYGGHADTADSGPTVGFGVVFFQEWYDSGASICDPQKIAADAAKTEQKLGELFRRWGLEAKPAPLCVCTWSS